MLSSLLKLAVFIGVGLLLTAVPEWQNNVLLNAEKTGWPGYFGTLGFNAVLLLFSYLSFRYFNTKYPFPKALLLQFTLWGIIGLVVEWAFIGHPPWSSAIQYGMFVYWAVVFGGPTLFVAEQAGPVRARLLASIIATSALLVLGSLVLLALDLGKEALLLFTIFCWVLIYTFLIRFFLQAAGYPPKTLPLLAAAIGVSLAEIVVPFPLDFCIFLASMGGAYWYVIRRLSSNRNHGS